MLAYINETGLHLPDYPDVLDYLQNTYRTIYGPDLYLEPDSQDGQLCAAFALALYDAYQLAGSVYRAYSPQTAQGEGLSSMVKINGLARAISSFSTVELRLVGQAGTQVIRGIAEDTAGNKWLLPPLVSIPLTGEVFASATAAQAGSVRAATGEVNKISTPTRGWQSVSNPRGAIVGAPVECDAELRSRQSISTALPSLTNFEGTQGAVAGIFGVTRSRGYENDTNEFDASGLPPHSIAMVVEGGDAAEIAAAIAAKKTPGTATYGDVRALVRDKYGVPNIINFFRPTIVPISLKIIIKPLPGYIAPTGAAIAANAANYLNNLQIGDDVLLSKLYTPINAADKSPRITRTFDVQSIEINGASEANLAINFNAVASCKTSDINVVLL